MKNTNLINFDHRNSIKENMLATLATLDNTADDYASGLYFTENTEFYLEGKDVIYVDYRHGRDESLKSKTVAKITNPRREGSAIVGEIDVLDEFKDTHIAKGIEDGSLFISTLTHPEKMRYDKATGEILEWEILNAAVTPFPDLKTKGTSIKPVMTLKEFTNAFDESTPDAGDSAEQTNKGGRTMKSVAELLGWNKDQPDEEAVTKLTNSIQTLKEANDAKDQRIAELEAENAKLKDVQTVKEKEVEDAKADSEQTALTLKELSDKVAEFGTLKETNTQLLTTVKELTGYLEKGRKEEGEGSVDVPETYTHNGKTYPVIKKEGE